MSKKRYKNGRNKNHTFVQLFHYMLASSAWNELTPAQRSVFVVADRYNGTNNGFISLSSREAAEGAGVNKDTASRALRVLAEFGFIECAQPSNFNCKVKKATEWRLAVYSCDRHRAPPTRAFLKWRPSNSQHRTANDRPNDLRTSKYKSDVSIEKVAVQAPFEPFLVASDASDSHPIDTVEEAIG